MSQFRTWNSTLAAVVMLLALAACGGGGESAPADVAPAAASAGATGSASLTGTVTAVGAEDADIVLKMDADPVCAGLHDSKVESQTMVADADGRLAHALVYVKQGLSGSYSAPGDAVVLAQKGCRYTPHVSAVMVGQTFKVINEDPTLHNIHARPADNPEFNQAQPFQGMELERTFETVEVMIPFKCDVHPWMSSYLAVLDHPFFAVTGEDGSYSIEGLPAGTYTLEAWHEVFGVQTAEATVEADGSAQVDFAFGSGG